MWQGYAAAAAAVYARELLESIPASEIAARQSAKGEMQTLGGSALCSDNISHGVFYYGSSSQQRAVDYHARNCQRGSALFSYAR